MNCASKIEVNDDDNDDNPQAFLNNDQPIIDGNIGEQGITKGIKKERMMQSKNKGLILPKIIGANKFNIKEQSITSKASATPVDLLNGLIGNDRKKANLHNF